MSSACAVGALMLLTVLTGTVSAVPQGFSPTTITTQECPSTFTSSCLIRDFIISGTAPAAIPSSLKADARISANVLPLSFPVTYLATTPFVGPTCISAAPWLKFGVRPPLCNAWDIISANATCSNAVGIAPIETRWPTNDETFSPIEACCSSERTLGALNFSSASWASSALVLASTSLILNSFLVSAESFAPTQPEIKADVAANPAKTNAPILDQRKIPSHEGVNDSSIELPLWPLIVGLAFLWFGKGGLFT